MELSMGWAMSDGWGAVVAAAVAVVGVVLSGWLAYRVGRRQVQDQAALEYRTWQRQTRFDAYRSFSESLDHLTESRLFSGISADLHTRQDAVERVKAAAGSVRLAGPSEVSAEVTAVMAVAEELFYAARNISRGRELKAARARFEAAAANALEEAHL